MPQENPTLQVSEALSRLLAHFPPLEIEQVPLKDSVGRVLADPFFAPIPLPPFDNSSMDGFALRAADAVGARPDHPAELRVVADIPAGSSLKITLAPGQAARIMTGAPLPLGADTVVPVEDTNFNFRQAGLEAPETVSFTAAPRPGDNIRPAGQDIRQGELVLNAGHRIRPQDAGLLSMLGKPLLDVYKTPRVAIFSSGDELLPPDAALAPGKIRDANTFILGGLVESCGARAINLGIAGDQPDQVQAILEQAFDSEADLILSSAGMSVGAFDFVRDVIEKHGRLEFWRVNMRPGKPFAFGYYRERRFIGLPGNPVSAFTGFEVFVRPALLRLQGSNSLHRTPVVARVQEEVESDGRESYLRAVVSRAGDEYVASLTGHQGSGNLFSLVQANALLLIPSGVKSVPSGARLSAWILDGTI